jgi:hypothetical protein
VKNDNRSFAFEGESEYQNRYLGKSVPREVITHRDKIYAPFIVPFEGESTYKASYPKKYLTPNVKRKSLEFSPMPRRYKFNDATTYGKSYTTK